MDVKKSPQLDSNLVFCVDCQTTDAKNIDLHQIINESERKDIFVLF